jgi:WD40 repeat protein
VAEQSMIRVENPQGDLISWSPVKNTVAYIASTQGSSWYVGDLNLLSAPLFDTPEKLTSQEAGELTWSPNGTTIAYLGFRRSDNLYTIGLAYPDGRPSLDLFPGDEARKDDFSSRKAISEWIDDERLRLDISCGVDCMQGIIFNLNTGLSTKAAAPTQLEWGMWSVNTNNRMTLPPEYADLVGQLNWSPDENQIAYTDEDGYVWIVNVDTGRLYPLDIGPYGTATETDWSYDGQYLAVHVDQKLKVFSFNCP